MFKNLYYNEYLIVRIILKQPLTLKELGERSSRISFSKSRMDLLKNVPKI